MNAVLLPAIDLLAEGAAGAQQAGETFLRGAPRLLWRSALARAPATALEASLGALRVPDEAEPATSIAWMHAATLATCPRPYVWLLGLNARTWPRAGSEDPLLPNHIVPSALLEPMPVTKLDRQAFAAIRAATSRQLVCSASRRDATGRLLGLSPLLPHGTQPERLRRARIPAHAMSEQDRLMARPPEFALTTRAVSAAGCWQDWNTPDITPHDGQVRPNHPVLVRALSRIHSATSLKALLRNPLGFVWEYALGWREPDGAGEALDLDPMSFGNLVHAILEAAMPAIEQAGGVAAAPAGLIDTAVRDARAEVAAQWETEQPVPPTLLWSLRLDEAATMALTALTWPLEAYPGQLSHTEVPFGDPDATHAAPPWDCTQPILLPGTNLRVRGRIDRLDIAADRSRARVVDYKTGKPRDPGVLNGGGEMQRCLYACAVQSLLGASVQVEAALLYPRGENAAYHKLADLQAALTTLTEAVLQARTSLLEGNALPGPDTGSTFDRLAFALPAGPAALNNRKAARAKESLGPAAAIWDQP